MHKPGHIRNAFIELVEEGETTLVFFDRDKNPRFEAMGRDEQLRWLSGQLWNCTDVLPSSACGELGIPQGSTYAQAARYIRQR